MHKDITAIIPVYNGEDFIVRCLDSILNQQDFDIKSLEVLALNDGSKDSSLKILNHYAKKYPGIVSVVNQENSGVANTRNRGVKLAKGKYVIFLDQDDWVDPDYCSTLFNEIEKGRYDAVFSGMKRPDETGKIINQDRYKKDTTEYFSLFMSLSVWAKIHRTSFLREAKIESFPNSFGEDIAFIFEEAQKTNNIKCIDYCGYNWFYNTLSVSNTSQRSLGKKNIASIVSLQDRLAAIDTKKTKVNTYFITMISAYYIFLTGKGSTVDEFMLGSETLLNNLKNHYPKWDSNPYLLKAPKGTLRVFSLGVKVFFILYKTRLLRVFARVYCKGGHHA